MVAYEGSNCIDGAQYQGFLLVRRSSSGVQQYIMGTYSNKIL